MTTPFSAGPQAVGYLHQVRYALHALLRETNDEAAVVIEGLDDIEVSDVDGLIRLDQLKHHLKGSANLTDTSPDLWKTLRIWSTQMRSKTWNPVVVRLNLVTTAEAPADTAAWYLRDHATRDVGKARDLLLQAIGSSRTKQPALLDSFDAFKTLPEREQLSLLHAVTIVDGAHSITDLEHLIKQQIRLAAPPSGAYLDRLYNEIEGWWFRHAVEHLVKSSQDPITLVLLRRKLWSITDRLQADNLPIDYADALPNGVIDADQDNRVFVQQLRCLGVGPERIRHAILDYYRAFEQRASWIRDDLLVDDELFTYERKLVDAWNQYRLAVLDESDWPEIDSEAVCKDIGRKILKWAQIEVDIRIKPNVDERFVLRGSFYILADTENPRVYWHPKFLQRLEELLAL
ncbi:MAG: hypothetical protein OHK0022_10890 [Roseiflexaceae bacterium]